MVGMAVVKENYEVPSGKLKVCHGKLPFIDIYSVFTTPPQKKKKQIFFQSYVSLPKGKPNNEP